MIFGAPSGPCDRAQSLDPAACELANAAGFDPLVSEERKRVSKARPQRWQRRIRGGRILVDTGRNAYSATFAAAYAVRAKSGAPVSAPCTWAEVESGAAGPRTFTLRSMVERTAAIGDVWAGLLAGGQSLSGVKA